MISNFIERMASGMVLCGGVLVGGALVLDNFTFTVKPGQRGFVRENYLDFSSRGILNPGIHLYIPYLQEPAVYDTSMQSRLISSWFATKDAYTVKIDCKVLYQPLEEMIPSLDKSYGKDYQNDIIPLVVTQALNKYISENDGATLMTNRKLINQKILEEVSLKSSEYGINVDNLVLTNLSLEREDVITPKKPKLKSKKF